MFQALLISLVVALLIIGGHIKPFDGSGGPPQHATVSTFATPAPPDGSGGPPQH